MAINYQGLEGKTDGVIKDCVFFVRNTVNVARAKAINPNNPRTEKQQNNRKNIAILVQFFQQLKPVLYRTLNHRPENRAVYHHFLALNLSTSISYGVFYPKLLIFSGTGLDFTAFNIVRNSFEGNKFSVSWSADISGNKAVDDYLQGILYSYTKKCFDISLVSHPRSSENCELVFKTKYQNDECIVFLCFIRKDISFSSNSYYQLFDATT